MRNLNTYESPEYKVETQYLEEERVLQVRVFWKNPDILAVNQTWQFLRQFEFHGIVDVEGFHLPTMRARP